MSKAFSAEQAAAAPATGAERQANFRASGRQFAVVIRDPVALDALDRLTVEHGGVTAVPTAALSDSTP